MVQASNTINKIAADGLMPQGAGSLAAVVLTSYSSASEGLIRKTEWGKAVNTSTDFILLVLQPGWQNQYHGCWWLGSLRHQAITNHGIVFADERVFLLQDFNYNTVPSRCFGIIENAETFLCCSNKFSRKVDAISSRETYIMKLFLVFNSLRSGDAYMRQWTNHNWFR